MSTQHTDGPWRLNAGDETVIMSSNGYAVARANCGGTTGIRMPEAEANARLIAAAPDLLAEGMALLEAAERHIFGDECKAERDAMRAAIAKATQP